MRNSETYVFEYLTRLKNPCTVPIDMLEGQEVMIKVEMLKLKKSVF